MNTQAPEETVEIAVINHFTGSGTPADIRNLFLQGAIFGHHHAINSKELVSIDKVIKIIKDQWIECECAGLIVTIANELTKLKNINLTNKP